METRARYVIIGAFVIAVIVAGFGFVYWLQNVGGLGARAYYRIRFEQPVSGLQPGAGVLFNGLKVGVIQRLGLDPSDLGGLVATISVEPWTPIRADTKVQITFQGLTGSPAILLRGGTSSAPRLVSLNGEIPTLDAPGDVGKNLSDSARDALANVNRVINENSKPLHSAITGISTFADMLGRNSKKIEGMLDGLGKMLGVGGGAKVQPKTYDLAAATAFPTIDKTIKVQMAVADVHAILAYDTQKILVRSAQGTFSDVEDGRWADNLPKLMQAKVIESFENAHLLGKVSRPFDMLEAPYKLELTIRNFQISLTPKPEANGGIRRPHPRRQGQGAGRPHLQGDGARQRHERGGSGARARQGLRQDGERTGGVVGGQAFRRCRQQRRWQGGRRTGLARHARQ